MQFATVKYRRKPLEVQALPFDGTEESARHLVDWVRATSTLYRAEYVPPKPPITVGYVAITDDNDQRIANIDVGMCVRDHGGGFRYMPIAVFEANHFPVTPGGIAAVVAGLLRYAETQGKTFADTVADRIRATTPTR